MIAKQFEFFEFEKENVEKKVELKSFQKKDKMQKNYYNLDEFDFPD